MKGATFATLSALLVAAGVGAGCGGATRVTGRSDAGSAGDVDSASSADAQGDGDGAASDGSTNDGGASFGLDGGIDADAIRCVLSDGGRDTCGGPWRCCREGTVSVEVLCVELDAACPGPPP